MRALWPNSVGLLAEGAAVSETGLTTGGLRDDSLAASAGHDIGSVREGGGTREGIDKERDR